MERLFGEYEAANDQRKEQIIQEVCRALVIHTLVEEKIFYPACRQAASDEEPLDEAQVEHDSAKVLIGDLLHGDRTDRFRDAKVKVLAEQIKHHVGEEEAPGKGLFAKAKAAGVDTLELARRVRDEKQALQNRRLSPSASVSIGGPERVGAGYQSEEDVARQQGPDRDERGRFMSDDDRGYRRSRYDDGRSYSSRGRDDDGRGWYGDSGGHAEAARRGWAERRGENRSFGRYDDGDDGRGYRSEDRDRDDRGRFMSDDDRGYRSRDYDDDRRGYRTQDRDRDDRGRFTSDDDDRRGYRSRSRDDDGDRGHGGWFGDSRGHAEAARRGWENRR